jgi:hypothetical protein
MSSGGFVSVAVLCAWVAVLPAARAHRLDEYLQATLLSIDTGRVDLQIDLTPGVAIASKVFGWIDTNHDGAISEAEGKAYARQMLGSVALKVDGVPASIQLVESRFPDFHEISLGVRTIRLRATAKVPGQGAGHHQLSYLNMHRTESSVYLVNALVPENPHLRLGEARRDFAQLGLTMEYNVAADSRWFGTVSLLIGCAIAALLVLRFGYELARDLNRRRVPALGDPCRGPSREL